VKAALDTNILVYAEGLNGEVRRLQALELVARLRGADACVPAQALAELFNVLRRKGGWAATDARESILSWSDALTVISTSAAVVLAATDLAADHQLTIWDATILAAAAEAGCRLLLSEDMQGGFTWRGVTIVNPFAAIPHALLLQLPG
jgi:predicted nucleic acid-binding protein